MTTETDDAVLRTAGPAPSRRGLPPELAATLLALSALLLGVIFHVPAFGIFFGWAAASLSFGIPRARISVLMLCLSIGGTFGAATLAAQAALIPALGTSVPEWVSSLLTLAIANPLMIALGRHPRFSSVPGMFIGFSTLLAVHLGGFAPVPGSIPVSLLVVIATTLTGTTFVWAYRWLTAAPATDAQRADHNPTAATPPRVASSASPAGASRPPRMRA